MDYIELDIKIRPVIPFSEILIAQLSELGFDGFEENKAGLKAYIPKDLFQKSQLDDLDLLNKEEADRDISYEINEIPYQNWNEVWEKDFEPVFVDNRLSILAPFHDLNMAKSINVIIQPQMSFGTGHHQTTWLVSKMLLDLQEKPESVLDMGSGTGILAILVEKLGAKSIDAVEIEPWSAVNMEENGNRNNCSKIKYYCGGIDVVSASKYDLILANINKNVLKSQISNYAQMLNPQGQLIISGFFDSDVEEMKTYAESYGFQLKEEEIKETWAALRFNKKKS